MPLSGNSAAVMFETPYYTPGQNDEFTVAVYDTQGNQRSTSVNITPNGGFNRAPVPKIALFPSMIMPGQAIRFDASGVSDPDHSASQVMVEWDLNGDGMFDTPPTTQKSFTMPFAEAGAWLVRHGLPIRRAQIGFGTACRARDSGANHAGFGIRGMHDRVVCNPAIMGQIERERVKSRLNLRTRWVRDGELDWNPVVAVCATTG